MKTRLIGFHAATIGALLMVGCATPYKSAAFSITGGYYDKEIEPGVFKVAFGGNGYTSQETVQIYTVYRCAELTLQNGFDHFAFLNARTDQAMNRTQGSGSTWPYPTFATHAVIRLFKGGKPADYPQAYSAQAVLDELTAQVKPSEHKSRGQRTQ